jgi:hypothetical protein
MSRWKTSFENQQINQRIQASLNALKSVKLENLGSQDKEEYERAVKVLQILVGRFSAFDPDLISLGSLQALGNWASNIQSQVNVFVQNRNIGHVHNVNTYLDEVLNIIHPIDIPTSPNDLKALADAGATYRQKLIEELDAVKRHADDIKQKFETFKNEITQAKIRLNENDATIQQQKSRLDTSIAEFQKQFSTEQANRNESFLKATAQLADAFKTTADKQKAEWDLVIADTKKLSEEYINHLKERKKEVDDIFGAIGSAALAGNFNDIANTERTFANRWRIIAFLFFVAMGAVGIAAFGLTFNNNPKWETFVFRLGTAVLLSVPAFYAANESSKHREREKTIRKNFLELSTIDAYLVHLPHEKQHEIKSKLSEKFFGVPEVRDKTEAMSNKDLLSFIEKLVRDLTRGR